MGKPLVIAVDGDVGGVTSALADVRGDLNETATTAQKAGSRLDSSLETTAGHADRVASKGAQAAGALGGLGGLASLAGGQVGALGNSMMVAGTATQALADAGDLLNVVTESSIVKNTLLATKTIVTSTAQKGAAVAQWALNAAMDANPIGLVVVSVAALAGGLTLLWHKSETFRNIVGGAFDGVKNAAEGLWDFVSSLPSKFAHAGTDMAHSLIDGIGGIGSNIADGIKNAINDLLHLPLTLPKVSIAGHSIGGQTLIPRLAQGGITTGPTLAVIGDNPGGREAIVPLNKYALGGGGNTYNITVNVAPGTSPEEVGRVLSTYIDAYERTGRRRRAA
jgi:phage-related protein